MPFAAVFDADFESDLHADTLAGLIERLELGPTAIMGGSAGSRVSLLTVIRHPEIASRLAVWWITGGFFGLLGLDNHYAGESWQAGINLRFGSWPKLAPQLLEFMNEPVPATT